MSCPGPGKRGHFSSKSLYVALALNGALSAVEFFGGYWTGSLALTADAAHNVADCAAIALGLFAHSLSLRPPDQKRTFGYHRAEVLAALANGAGLCVVAAFILRAAYSGFRAAEPGSIRAGAMLAFACAGLLCNAGSGFYVFLSGRSNINARGVFLHLFSDALSSVAAVLAALVILKTGWLRADATASAAICAVMFVAAFFLVADAAHILMEGAPANLNLDEIRRELSAIAGVREVHDLHLWSLTEGSEALSGHLLIEPGRDQAAALACGKELLQARFGISHVTLQIEKEQAP